MKKVIVADGNAPLRRLIRATLEGEDREVWEAVDSAQVLRSACEQHPDLILVDALLPDVNGVLGGAEVCRTLKADPSTSDITILLLVDTDQIPQQEQLSDAGADGYITKPFSPLELLNLAERALAS
jgi:CheY-like chemotaxis protein